MLFCFQPTEDADADDDEDADADADDDDILPAASVY